MKAMTLAAVVLLATAFASVVEAQPNLGPSLDRGRRPTISPYLQLLNRRGSTASNYYNLYRPERRFEQFQRDARRSAEQLQSQINGQRTQIDRLQNSGSQLSPSGTAAGFMTHQGYFGSGASRR